VTPQAFLELLWQFKPEDLYVLIWTYPGKRSHWFRDIAKAAACVASSTDSDIYLGVGLSKTDLGPACRCPSDEIAGIAGLWAALSVIPASMPPTIVISTGNGAHAWWLLKEPYIFDDADDRKETASLVSRWHTLLRLNAAARGWAFDRLSDLARVLRIPGTKNFKDPNNPKRVAVYSTTDRRYNLSDFDECLDELRIPDPDTHEQKARAWAGQLTDAPIVINLNAEVPEQLIKGWLDIDPRFRTTWFRQRSDLKDQSQSGYDLALADFGMDAGLGAQQIIDLIIQHRRIHGQKPRTRLDYFERTLAKAAHRNDGARSLPPLTQAATTSAPSGVPAAQESPEHKQQPTEDPEGPTDPMAAKAVLCEYISQVLGVRILRIVKITGKEPTYQIVLENGKVELADVSKLLNQNSVRMVIATATNRLITRLKPKQWEQLAQCLLDALIEEEGGPETQLEGVMRMYLEQYLTDVAFIPSIEGQPSNAIRRPTLIDGQIAVNSADLQLFVNKTFVQNLSVKAVASMLAAIGAKNIRVRGAKNREQGRWLLPIDQFNPTDYAVQRDPEGQGGPHGG